MAKVMATAMAMECRPPTERWRLRCPPSSGPRPVGVVVVVVVFKDKPH